MGQVKPLCDQLSGFTPFCAQASMENVDYMLTSYTLLNYLQISVEIAPSLHICPFPLHILHLTTSHKRADTYGDIIEILHQMNLPF